MGTGERGRVTRGLRASPWRSSEAGGGSRRWKQEVASPPVRATRRRPPGKRRRRLAPGLWWTGPVAAVGKAQVGSPSLLFPNLLLFSNLFASVLI